MNTPPIAPRPHPDSAIERALATPGLTTDADVLWLAEQAKGRGVVIELGPFMGRSTLALVAGGAGVVYAIDDWNRSHIGRLDVNAREACHANLADLIGDRVILIEQRTQAGVPEELRGITADMLWIDADHSYAAVRNDIQRFAPLVRKGGLICGHDYNVHHRDVMRAVDDAYGKKRVRTLGIHRSIWWIA